MRAAFNFVALTDEVERLIKCVPKINAAKHLAWTPKVRQSLRQIVFQNNGILFASVLSGFDDNTMALLSICSDHLETYNPEPIADQAGVARLLAETLELIRQVSTSEIDLYIREYMLRHLQLVADALFDFRTKGFESLWNGLSACQGHHYTSVARVGVDQDTLKSTPLWKKVVAVVVALGALVEHAEKVEHFIEQGEKVSQLIGKSWRMLPDGDAASRENPTPPAQ